jgi:tripartite-type tricarboxylate transporter receptor subunit TctC
MDGTAMNLPRREFLRLAVGAVALPAASGLSSSLSWAQSYPSRPVRMIVGFPPGGDVVPRLLAQWLSDRLGQSFIVENRREPARISQQKRS